MKSRTIQLLGSSRNVLATGQVVWEDDRYTGQLDLRSMPLPLRRNFEEFEELVNGQIFSLLDDIEQRIDDLAIKVVFDDGREALVEDLQIYPSTGLASFKVIPLLDTSLSVV